MNYAKTATIVVTTFVNCSAVLGATVGPLIIGALTKADQLNGWRKFYVCALARHLLELTLILNSGLSLVYG